MPYSCTLVGSGYHLTKTGGSEILGSHKLKRDCTQQMRAIYANELSKPENIVFNNIISEWAVPDFDVKIANAKDEIHVVINSEGGDFWDAIKMHQRLRNSGKPVIVHVNPLAFSAGAILALAGDKIYMPENGAMMFHPTKVELEGAKDAIQLEAFANSLRTANEILVNTLMSKTKKSKEDCEAIVNNSTWFTAQEAKNIGIVDEIVPIYREVRVQAHVPERILNFFKEKSDMPLKELCDKFGVTDEAGLETLINDLRTNQKPRQIDPSESIVNMITRARETELTSLVSSGKCIPAVITELRTKYLTPERVKNDIRTENSEFDTIVLTLSKNERVINFAENSGNQQLPGGTGTLNKNTAGENKDDNVLVERMKAERERIENRNKQQVYGH